MEDQPIPQPDAPVERLLTGIKLVDVLLGALLAFLLAWVIWLGIIAVVNLIDHALAGTPNKMSNKMSNKMGVTWLFFIGPTLAIGLTTAAGFFIQRFYRSIGIACLITAVAAGLPTLGTLAIFTFLLAAISK